MNRTARLTRTVPLARDPEQAAEWLERSRQPIPRSARLATVSPGRMEAIQAGTGKSAPGKRGSSSGEFSAKVKLQIRTRAGEGDPDQAVCECCGVDLGRYGGQIQHIVARGMGGTSNPVMKTAANGALLCGTAQDGDHGLAESRDPGMRRKGFWLPQGTDPRMVPMILWTGRKVWRSEDGRYLTAKPREVAA